MLAEAAGLQHGERGPECQRSSSDRQSTPFSDQNNEKILHKYTENGTTSRNVLNVNVIPG